MQSLKSSKIQLAKALMEKAKRVALAPLNYARQHQKQREASNSRKNVRALFWGNRVGKTEWGAQEAAKVGLGEHGWITPGEIWVFSPSFDDHYCVRARKPRNICKR